MILLPVVQPLYIGTLVGLFFVGPRLHMSKHGEPSQLITSHHITLSLLRGKVKVERILYEVKVNNKNDLLAEVKTVCDKKKLFVST